MKKLFIFNAITAYFSLCFLLSVGCRKVDYRYIPNGTTVWDRKEDLKGDAAFGYDVVNPWTVDSVFKPFTDASEEWFYYCTDSRGNVMYHVSDHSLQLHPNKLSQKEIEALQNSAAAYRAAHPGTIK